VPLTDVKTTLTKYNNSMKNYTRAAFLSRVFTVAGASAMLVLGACSSKDEGDADKTDEQKADAAAKKADAAAKKAEAAAAKKAAADKKAEAAAKKKRAVRENIEDIAIPAGLTQPEIRLAIIAAATNYGPSYDRAVKEAPPNAGTLVYIGPKSQEQSQWQPAFLRDGIRVSKTLVGAWGRRTIGYEYVIEENAITHRFDRDGKIAGQTVRHITALDDAIADNLKALAAAKQAEVKQ
jgi:hypothetical protein